MCGVINAESSDPSQMKILQAISKRSRFTADSSSSLLESTVTGPSPTNEGF